MRVLVGIQGYCFHQIYQRDGKKFEEHLDEVLARVSNAGIEGWEQSITSVVQANQLATLLAKHGLKTQSIYANAKLHLPGWEAAVESVVQQARCAKPLGVNIVVVNPEPIQWGGPQNKDDPQLRLQAKALQVLGEQLHAQGMTLAYHTHDPEMRAAAREFHHMLTATDPQYVRWCLDTHWIFRGAENSSVALDDIIERYAPRLASLHIRQSQQGIWTEALGDGDIDYAPLAARLKQMNFSGPLIIEQCFEKGTPQTMSSDEAQRRGREWVRRVFGV